jgi:hypothetical protein
LIPFNWYYFLVFRIFNTFHHIIIDMISNVKQGAIYRSYYYSN